MAHILQIDEPHSSVLRTAAQPVPIEEIPSAKIQKTIKQMEAALDSQPDGVALAAPQIGIPLRIFVVSGKVLSPSTEKDGSEGGKKGKVAHNTVFINPEITSRKGSELGEEGCLSLPDLYADVRRAEAITVEAYDLDGQGFEFTLDDLPARVVQHELDHLDGVLFIDRVSESAMRELALELGDLEAHFRQQQAAGEVASDESLRSELETMAVALTQE